MLFSFFDEGPGFVSRTLDISGLSASTDYHFVVTKTGITVNLYIDKVLQTLVDEDSTGYIAMDNLTSTFRLGASSDSGSVLFDGKIKKIGAMEHTTITN